MNPDPSGSEPVWQVTRVEDTFSPTSLGGDNRVKRVFFTIMGENETYVDVPWSKFNAQGVSTAIEQHVMDMVNVLNLKGQSF